MLDVSDYVTDLADLVPEVWVEGSGGENDLGEAGGGFDGTIEPDAEAGIGDAVQRFTPPLVTRDAEPGNRRCRVDELGEFLVESEPRDEVLGSFGDGEPGVAEWVVG